MVAFTIGGDAKPAQPAKTGGQPESAKRAPGRPPGSTKHKQNVEQALSTMNSAYNLASMGALMARRPRTAGLIAQSAEQWQAGNREAFESSEKLAAAIANVGQTSGIVTFVSVNAYAAFQIWLAMREESADIREARAQAVSEDDI